MKMFLLYFYRINNKMSLLYTVDADDIQLVEMLADLAEENEVASTVDDDSVLGSQYSMFSEPIRNEPEEEEIEDLNITSLDLQLSSWESTYNQKSNQCDDTIKIIDNKNTEDDLNVIQENYEDVTLMNFPQVDGVNDLHEILEYEKKTTNNLNNKNNMAIQCLPKINKNSKHNSYISIINAKKDYAIYISHRNLNLMDIVKYIVNNPNKYYLKKELYNFINKYYFHIFLKTSKTLRSTNIKYPHADTSVVRYTRYLKDNKKRMIYNKKEEKKLYVTRCQLQPDHRDLDVYDIDEIETFETLEYNNYVADYEEDKCNCERNSKSDVQKGVLLNSNYCLHHELCDFSVKFTISNIDGATADSSDAESEADDIIDIQEERVCAYNSDKRNVPQSIVQITPKKRKLDLQNDDHKSPDKRRNVTVKTPKRRYNSPGKASRSPQLSGNYSPLNITITSPKSSKSPVRQFEQSPKKGQCISTSEILSTTPKHKIHPLRVSLLREKFKHSDPGNLNFIIFFMKNLSF